MRTFRFFGGLALLALPFFLAKADASEKWVGPDAVYLSDSFGIAQTCKLFDGSPVKRAVVPGDVLYASYAVSATASKGAFRFEIVVVSSDGTHSVHARTLNPEKTLTDVGWQNVRVPLAPFAGEDVEVRFSVQVSCPPAAAHRPARPGEAFWGGVRVGSFARKPGQMNVILISLDTLRADHLGCYGHWRDTSPNIDQMAAEGVRFEEAISQASWTKPSHASIFTGLYPATHRVIGAGFSRDHVITDLTLTEVLQQNGFVTHAVTAAGFVKAQFGFYHGFDQYVEKRFAIGKGPGVGRLMEEARDFLGQSRNDRFFLFFHTYEIHSPRHHQTYGRSPRDRYDSGIRYTDNYIGDLMDALKELGLADNTLVILTSDHGEDLGAHYKGGTHGHSMYDELLHVPLIYWCPPLFSPLVVKGFQARSIDDFPTLMDILGLDKPARLQGESLLPYLKGKKPPKKSVAMSEGVLRGPEQKSVRYVDGSRRYKLVVAPRIALPDSDMAARTEVVKSSLDGLGKRTVAHIRDTGGLEFFDLRADPEEKNNLASKNPRMMRKMMDMLVERMSLVPIVGAQAPDEPEDKDPEEIEELRALGY